MIRLNLDRLFKIKGVERKYNYLVSRGFSNTYAHFLSNNKVRSIAFDKMEQLCRDFNCTPNDLFDFVPEKDETLPADHSLWKIKKDAAVEEVNKLLNELPMEKIEEIYRFLKEGKEGLVDK